MDKRREKVVETLRHDPVRAEVTLVLAAAVALADGKIMPEEHELFEQLARGLALDEGRANGILQELTAETATQAGPGQ